MLRRLPAWLITLLALLACWPAWLLAGVLAAEVGLFVLDLPTRIAAIILLLGLLSDRIDHAGDAGH